MNSELMQKEKDAIERLKELIYGAEGIGKYLYDTGCDYQICIDWLKDEMGIDLEGRDAKRTD